MIPKECKRLIEVDFPIAEVGRHAAREKSIRHGHPSTLHLWWARRPLASSRAVLLGLLMPDPCDPNCPEDFKPKARKALAGLPVTLGPDNKGLRQALLDFIARFANWDRSTETIWLEASRNLVKASYPEETPLMVDPFAGGGSIPLEALRIGCDAFASDLNPVAGLILKTLLEDIPRHGPGLADELRKVGKEIKEQAEIELKEYYPNDLGGSKPIAYLWARTARCESPNCGAEIPLMRSFWLSKKKGREKALRYEIDRSGSTPEVKFEIFEPKSVDEVQTGTVNRGNATCPACWNVLPVKRIRVQITKQRGGADVVFDENRNRIGGARLLAVVTISEGQSGRNYRLPNQKDYQSVWKVIEYVKELPEGKIPNEPLPPIGTLGFRVQRYGMFKWGYLFTARQKVGNIILSKIVNEIDYTTDLIKTLLSLLVSKGADGNNSLVGWMPGYENPAHLFARQAIPIVWDFCESTPSSNARGVFLSGCGAVAKVIDSNRVLGEGQVQLADACNSPLPDESCAIWFTDPPYYDAIPYSDLSDFFFVWLKRLLPDHPMLKDPFDETNNLTPKQAEIVQDNTRSINGGVKDRNFFEIEMEKAFAEGRRILTEEGVASVVFAHKTTEGWEALLTGMLKAGWTITASWPITTESPSRLRARESAALSASVHLVCRPRPENAHVGEWEEILRKLPKRIKQWVTRLDKEGIHGADLVFSCIGPALELFSKYRKVETAEGEEVGLGPNETATGEAPRRGYLSYIWEVVGRTALEQVLSEDDGGEIVGSLEEDARITALFLWTRQSTKTRNGKKKNGDSAKIKGLSLPYDIVRRFAQPLGIHLPDWEDRIITIEKGVVRLIPIEKRAKQLFGEDITYATSQFELDAQVKPQMELALAIGTTEAPVIKGKRRAGRATITSDALENGSAATTLDRIHAAMLLQSGGKTNALRALLKQELDRGSEFLRLANSLSALYPQGLEEKRLLDAMLLAVPR